jgi:hypothetical protein
VSEQGSSIFGVIQIQGIARKVLLRFTLLFVAATVKLLCMNCTKNMANSGLNAVHQPPRFVAAPNKQFKLTHCATQPFMHAL